CQGARKIWHGVRADGAEAGIAGEIRAAGFQHPVIDRLPLKTWPRWRQGQERCKDEPHYKQEPTPTLHRALVLLFPEIDHNWIFGNIAAACWLTELQCLKCQHSLLFMKT